jgi:hypothetical protein
MNMNARPAMAIMCLLAQLAATSEQEAESVRRYRRDEGPVANPERGFYLGGSHCERQPFDVAMLRDYRRREGITLLMCVFYLGAFRDAPIDAAALHTFEEQMDRVREAGFKAIVRFAYSDEPAADDAGVDRIAGHLRQLTPVLRRHRDVLLVFQEGFIGAWGEGALSRHFGDTNALTLQQIHARTDLRGLIAAAVPDGRVIQVRTPFLKQLSFGTEPVGASEIRAGLAAARVGHYNDCFLHGPVDSGTYRDRPVEDRYLAAETTFLPMGGETCGLAPPRTDCPIALAELRQFHWSFLNLNYHPDVLAGWRDQGCFDEIGRRLGYRLRLTDGRFPRRVRSGESLRIRLNLHNSGWAAPFNRRRAYLVLRHVRSGGVEVIALESDPRTWLAGTDIALDQAPRLPARVSPGTYRLWLALPDPESHLAGRPEYAIRLANADLWDARTGWNDLQAEIEVMPAQ